LEAQSKLLQGPDGIDKPMSCSAGLLAKIAGAKPRDAQSMERLLGDRRATRFGDAFLEVLRDAT
jgi:ATP-dependent DNA helicase RecQ